MYKCAAVFCYIFASFLYGRFAYMSEHCICTYLRVVLVAWLSEWLLWLYPIEHVEKRGETLIGSQREIVDIKLCKQI